MLAFAVRCLLAYLLGSVLGSLVVGRLRGGVDIRTQGSGNAGGTNALRTQGVAFALWVMLIDVGKGVLAAGAMPRLPMDFLGADRIGFGWTAAACGALAVVGHVYPVFFGFRGGKGVATFLGVLAALAPLALVPGLVVWVLCLTFTGYVGLSTVLAGFTVAGYAVLFTGLRSPLFAFALVMALFILYTHRSNIQRLRTGTENQFKRAMLLRRRG
jgi:acyl phosphate:glycerol-3-phosphate acyltransferase